ncbi:MAG: hypothetical protein JWO81_3016, partial [Alphaproteobacteria bacterium]|nr:hypothetical protein [Alphaproteobacteria bacterium]
MNDRIMIAAAAFCGLIAARAAAAAPAGRPDGLAVRDVMSWTVPDSRTVYVEDAAGRWFRVDLDTPCTPLAGAFGIAL